MPDSNLALLKGEHIVTDSKVWRELLKIDFEPNRRIYIRDIVIRFSAYASTTLVHLNVQINGEDMIKDLIPVDQVTLGFGGNLVFDGKKDRSSKAPLLINVKSDGTTSIYATATVTGNQEEI